MGEGRFLRVGRSTELEESLAEGGQWHRYISGTVSPQPLSVPHGLTMTMTTGCRCLGSDGRERV